MAPPRDLGNPETTSEYLADRHWGWTLGKDGQWRLEIPYGILRAGVPDALQTVAAENDAQASEAQSAALGDILEDEPLFAAYPELREAPVIPMPGDRDRWGRSVYGYAGNGTIVLFADKLRDQVKLLGTLYHEIQHLIQHIEGFEGGEGRKVPTWSFYANAMGEAEARVAGASAMTPYGYEMDAYFRHPLELTEGEIKDEDGTWRRQTYDDLTFEAQRDKILRGRGQDDATQGILNQFTNAKTLEALAKLAKKHLDVTAMTWGPKEGGGFEVTVEYDDDVIWWNTYGSETGALNSMRRIFLNRYANRSSEARSSLAEVALFATGKKQTRQKVAEAYASFGVSVTPETAAVIADRINADLEEQRNARRSRLKPGEQPRDRAFGLVDALAKAYDTNWAEAQKEAFSKGVAGTFGAAREMAEEAQAIMEARRQEAEAVTGTAPAVLETEMGFDIEATLMAAPEPSPRATGRRRRSPRHFTRTLSSCEMVQTSRTTTRACESCMTRRRLSLAGRIGRGDGMDSEKTSEQRGHRVYSLESLELEEARQRSANTASTALPRTRDLTSTVAKLGGEVNPSPNKKSQEGRRNELANAPQVVRS